MSLKEVLDYIISNNYGVIISLLFAGGALIVSICSLFFTQKVSNIAEEKLRLDLYNKRFEVYSRVLKYALVYIKCEQEKLQNSDIEENFIIAFRESQFLFEDNSGIFEIIKDIQQICSKISYYYAYKEELKLGSEKHEEVITNRNTIEGKLLALENAMLNYLQFNLLRRNIISKL